MLTQTSPAVTRHISTTRSAIQSTHAWPASVKPME
jgi:hypothetical protein